jgi:vacuolar protein sorting-associated protein 13A/C
MFDFTIEPFEVDAVDWSSSLMVSSNISMFFSSFNVRNSHWEPLIEPWRCAFKMQKNPTDNVTDIELDAPTKMDLNITHDFLDSVSNILSQWEFQKKIQNTRRIRRAADAPYRIRNETGYEIAVWKSRKPSDEAVTIKNGDEVPWRFDDWQQMRQVPLIY